MEIGLEYNNERTPLSIPEYGRHIHKMIAYALTLEDKEHRTKVAKAIIGVMGNMNPHLRDVPDFQHKLWDQLYIMSDFQLDVDGPYDKPSKELIFQRPDPLPYPQNHPKYRFYGNNIKRMIDVARSWEEGEKKDALIFTIANHMKKCYVAWNKDTVDDKVIFDHLSELSGGAIHSRNVDEELTETSTLIKQFGQRENQSQNKARNKRNKKRR